MSQQPSGVKVTHIVRSKLSIAYLRRVEASRAEQSLESKVKK
jgi:hypothetical protein